MKKLWFFLILLTCLLFAGIAQADLQLKLPDNYITSVTSCGDTLLACNLVDATIYAWPDADGEPTAYPLEVNTKLIKEEMAALNEKFSDAGIVKGTRDNYRLMEADGQLYLMGTSKGTLCRLTLEDGKAVAEALFLCDLLPSGGKMGSPFVNTYAAADGQLFLVVTLNDTLTYQTIQYNLYAYDLTTGERREIASDWPSGALQRLFSAVPGPEGKLIVTFSTEDNERHSFYLYDLASDTYEDIGDTWPTLRLSERTDIVGYDRASGRLIYTQDNTYYAFDGDQATPFARQYSYGLYAERLTPSGLMLVWEDDEQIVRFCDPSVKLQVVTLSSYGDINGIQNPGFERANPDIQLQSRNAMDSGSEVSASDLFSTTMTVHATTPDLFLLPIGPLTESIRARGYAVPITGEPAEAYMRDLYPYLLEQVTDEKGQLVMLPWSIGRSNSLAYSSTAAERLGIAESDLPTTFGELFTFIRDWDAIYGDLAEDMDISLFNTSISKSVGALRLMLFRSLLALAQSEPDMVRANIAELGALLDASLPLGSLRDRVEPVVASTPSFEDYLQLPQVKADGDYLFTISFSALPSSRIENFDRYWTNTHPLELSVLEGVQPVANYKGTVLVINPYSEHQEQALRLANYLLENMDATLAANTLQSAAPVPSTVMGTYEQMQAALARDEEALAAATDDIRELLRSYVESDRATLTALEPFLYSVEQEQLNEYARSVEMTQAVWLDLDIYVENCMTVWNQFLVGTASGERVLRRALEVSQMMQMEYER